MLQPRRIICFDEIVCRWYLWVTQGLNDNELSLVRSPVWLDDETLVWSREAFLLHALSVPSGDW